MKIKKLINKKIAILGFAREGKSTLEFLKKIWVQDITVLDENPNIIFNETEEIKAIFWEKCLDNLEVFDIIIKAPWISPYKEKIFPHREKLTSQTEIFYNNYKWKVIWITATKGKSTTVSVLFETLKNAWLNTKLVWNIWKPVLDEIDLLWGEKYDFVIYEMSSYMLEDFSPDLFIWILWNIFRCHVDWHNHDFATYKQAKFNILKNAEYKISNYSLKQTLEDIISEKISYFWLEWDSFYKEKKFYLNWKHILNDENILLKWDHNRINISSIICALGFISERENINLSELIDSLKKTLETFWTLPHRLEEIGTYNWITFVNDSLASTPDSTAVAIKTYAWKIWTIFLWWFDYWFEFENFAKVVKEYKIKNIVYFPDTWKDIKREIDKLWYNINFIETSSMKEAVEFAYKNCKSWEIALLSCASPSFSMYNNYVERGEDFKKEAEEQKR